MFPPGASLKRLQPVVMQPQQGPLQLRQQLTPEFRFIAGSEDGKVGRGQVGWC